MTRAELMDLAQVCGWVGIATCLLFAVVLGMAFVRSLW